MKVCIVCLLIILSMNVMSQKKEGFRIIDLSQLEIRLLNEYKNADSAIKSKVYLDSIYRPYKMFWSGYCGKESSFLSWMNNEGVNLLDSLNKKNLQLHGSRLPAQFAEVTNKMRKLTGYLPSGDWYVVYFHGATNLGGISSGEMVIDLSHESNSSSEIIMTAFPHEMTHNLMNTVNPFHDTTAISSIIGEGFAVYVSHLYYGKRSSLAKHLAYTDKELEACKQHEKEIKEFFAKNKFSSDPKIINQFRSRNYKLLPDLPGAIGYYIGYCIIKDYVKNHKINSWKDVFHRSPVTIYELSGY